MPFASGNATFDAAAIAAENVRAAAIGAAVVAAGTNPANQATLVASIRTADIAYYTSIINSGATNGIAVENARIALNGLLGAR